MRRTTRSLASVLPALVTSIIGAAQAGCSARDALAPPEQTLPAASVAAPLDLQAMIDGAADGETVRVPAGRHRRAAGLVIRGRTNLRVVFAPGAEVLVDDTEAAVIRIERSSRIAIHGGLLRHREPLPEYECHGAVVEIVKSVGITIEGCALHGCGAIGVDAADSRDLTVQRCAIRENSFNAIYVHDVTDLRVYDCVIERNANFLQGSADGLEFSGNLIRDNRGYGRR